MIRHLHLTEQGLELFVGSLEAEILKVMWQENRKLTMKAIVRAVQANRPQSAFTTIQTTVMRMWQKKLLIRHKPFQKVATYTVVCNENEFIRACIALTIRVINENYHDIAESELTQ